MREAFLQYRFVAVVALLAAAALLASEKGRLPLALRGIRRTLGRYAASTGAEGKDASAGVPAWRRAVALLLALLAFVVAVV